MLLCSINIRVLGLHLVLFLCYISSYATTNIDSLLHSIQVNSQDIPSQLKIIEQEVKKNYRTNTEAAFLLLNKGIELTKKAKKDTTHAYFLYIKGRIHKRLGDRKLAESAYQEAKQIYSSISHNDGLSKVINELGWLEIKEGAYPKARILFLEAISPII